jgi:hypothetical protein
LHKCVLYLRIYRVHDELVDHLTRSTPLNRGEALRVIQDVLAYFDETTEEFVRRRHRELQAQGLVNATIFERIEAELKYRLRSRRETRGLRIHVRNRRIHRQA